MKNLEEQFLDKIKKEVKEIYKDKLDLYLITPDNFNGLNERVPVICKKCNEITWITPQDLLEGKFECKYCEEIKHYKNIVYRLKRNLVGFEFDYSTIDVNNPDAIYTVRCLRCGKVSRFTLRELSSKYLECSNCSNIRNMKFDQYTKIGIKGTIEINCSNCGKKFRALIKDLSEYMICPKCDKINFLKGRLSTKYDEVFDLSRLSLKDINLNKNTVRLYSFYNREFKIYNIDKILSFGNKLISRLDKGIYYTKLSKMYENDFKVPDIRKDDLLCYEDKIKLVCNNCGKVYEDTILSLIGSRLECICITKRKEEEDLRLIIEELTSRFNNKFDFSSITTNNLNNIFSDEVDVKCNDCGEIFKVSLRKLLLDTPYSHDTIHHFCKKYIKDYIKFQKEDNLYYSDILDSLKKLLVESKAEGLEDNIIIKLFTKFRNEILDERLKLLE